MNINTQEYWNERFKTKDWQEKGGNNQTAFFYNLLIDLLPKNYQEEIRTSALNICDLGCAEGDGTYILKQHFQDSEICGIDIAPDAINNAKMKYEGMEFSTIFDSAYDVVISSNTLEHFVDPFQEIEAILQKTKKYLILLLPYQEYERIDEHFFTFDFNSFPKNINGFQLTFFHSVNADSIYWPGKQVIVIYEREPSINVFEKNLLTVIELNEQLRDHAKTELDHAKTELDHAKTELDHAKTELDHAKTELDQIIGSISWRITKPLRKIKQILKGIVQNDA